MRALTYSGKRVWKAVVKGRPRAQAIAPRRHAQRPFGRDMDGAGLEAVDQLRQAPRAGSTARRISG